MLVTGAVRGIGLEVARQLARAGATVVVSARDRDAAAATASQLAGEGDVRALPVALDVADDASVAAAAEAVGADPGRLDVLVNNAAAFVDWTETTTGADLDEARRILDTNLLGAWRVTVALLPLLRRSPHPRVVNVSSGAGSTATSSSGSPGAVARRPPTASARRRSTRSPAAWPPSSPTPWSWSTASVPA